MRAAAAELAVALGIAGLGGWLAVETAALDVAAGYARVGPRAAPAAVAAGLLVVGGWLAFAAATGRWQRLAPAPSFAWRPVGLLSAALLADLALMQPAGFVVATTVLFVLAARAFGSRRLLRDGLLGAGVAAAVFVVFTRGLDLSLPAGVLGRL